MGSNPTGSLFSFSTRRHKLAWKPTRPSKSNGVPHLLCPILTCYPSLFQRLEVTQWDLGCIVFNRFALHAVLSFERKVAQLLDLYFMCMCITVPLRPVSLWVYCPTIPVRLHVCPTGSLTSSETLSSCSSAFYCLCPIPTHSLVPSLLSAQLLQGSMLFTNEAELLTPTLTPTNSSQNYRVGVSKRKMETLGCGLPSGKGWVTHSLRWWLVRVIPGRKFNWLTSRSSQATKPKLSDFDKKLRTMSILLAFPRISSQVIRFTRPFCRPRLDDAVTLDLQEHGLSHITVYGNKYIHESSEVANRILHCWSMAPTSNSHKGYICWGNYIDLEKQLHRNPIHPGKYGRPPERMMDSLTVFQFQYEAAITHAFERCAKLRRWIQKVRRWTTSLYGIKKLDTWFVLRNPGPTLLWFRVRLGRREPVFCLNRGGLGMQLRLRSWIDRGRT
jgi:hypothetical protein